MRPDADPTRRRLWAALAVLLGVLVLWLAFVAVRLVQADHRLEAGIAAADRAKAALTLTDLQSGDGRSPSLETAAIDLRRAHGDVNSPLVAPFRLLPLVGTQLRSVDALSGAAATVAHSGSSALSAVHLLLAEPHRTPAQRVRLVGRLASVLHRLRAQVDGVGLGPRRGLVGALRRERAKFLSDVTKLSGALRRADGAAEGTASLLRGNHTYLLIAANNAEMRAGAGMALEVGTLRVTDGELAVGQLLPAGRIHGHFPAVAPTGDLRQRWGGIDPGSDFRSLLFSPQFPANAALAARMWSAYAHTRVAGVLLIDVQALDDLLGVVGPVSAGGVTLSSANCDAYLLEQQYVGVVSKAAEARRHQVLGLLAAGVFGRLTAGGVPLPSLVRALGQAADGRHLLAWSASRTVEADWQDAAVSGAVGGNEMLLSLLNQGANKLDPHQQLTARMTVDVTGSESRVTVRVTDRNATPPSLSGYAAGGLPGAPPARVYTGAVELDFPAYARAATAAGYPELEAAGPDYGAQTLAVPVIVPDTGTRTVTFRFVLPGRHATLVIDPSARVPAATWEVQVAGHPATRFTDGGADTLRW